MNSEERYFTRILFKINVLTKDGQAFEDFFVKIMQYHNPNFQAVKPYGRCGDRKNDGFDKTSGTYYQVYAPENLQKNEKKAVEKLLEDFHGLYHYWHEKVCPIKNYFYVLNDKYKNAPVVVFEALAKVAKDYLAIEFKPFLNHDLEEIFLSLPDDRIYDIVGFIPDPKNFSLIKLEILRQVVEHLIHIESPYNREIIPENPDFERKISFNKLSEQPANLLRIGSYQVSHLEDYFTHQSDLKELLRSIFTNLYNEGLETILPSDIEKEPDTVFFYILEKSCPDRRKFVQEAVIVLMSYYFEYCDIYETPPEPGQKSLFT